MDINSKHLPLYMRKIAVVVHLTSILPKSNESPSRALMTEVNFLISMLKKTNSFSLQEIQDFEKLLSSINKLVKSVKPTAKQLAAAAKFPRELLVTGKLGVPMQPLKDYWQKCLNCGNLQFGTRKKDAACGKCAAMFNHGEIVFSKSSLKEDQEL